MPVRVAINGFGRTGRAMFRAAHEQGADIEWAGINDIMGVDALARLLAKDSVYGRFPGTVEALDGAIRVDGHEIPVFAESDPAALPWRDVGRRGRDRVERALPRACRRRPPPRRRRAQGDHLGPGQGAGRHGRARRQLRRGLRPRPPPRHLQRLLHDELPRAGGQGAARGVRDPARRDDDRPRLHGRPAAARRAAQGPAARPRRRAQPRPDHDRRRQGDRPRDPGARGPDAGLRRPRPDPDGLDGRPDDRDRAGDDRRRRSTPPSAIAPTPDRSRESSPTARMRSCRPTSSARRTRRSSTRA